MPGLGGLELQAAFARGIRQRLQPAAIGEPAAVEHDRRDALFLRGLGGQRAELLRRRDVQLLALSVAPSSVETAAKVLAAASSMNCT